MAVIDAEKYQLELLAPAGSYESAKAAVNAGADAVYMGGPFYSARAYAESSSKAEDLKNVESRNTTKGFRKAEDISRTDKISKPESISKIENVSGNEEKSQLLMAIEYCHLRGVKVYMTLNILMKQKEMTGLYEYLKPYADAGVDAVIVQDLGVMKFVRENFPKLPVHVSTQAAVTGPRYAKLLKAMGAKRVVPARELSLTELKYIRDEADIEVEAFVHGALCYSYSGQCLMSSMIGGRSGNRGRCAGTCRLPVDIYDEDNNRLNKADEQYILSMKDLCGLKRIREMADAGVCSYKIEGRMKSPLYVAGVTSIYRKYFDALPGLPKDSSIEEDMRLLREAFDRGGSTDGYLSGHNGRNMISLYEKKMRIPDRDFVDEITQKYLEKDMLIPVSLSFSAHLGSVPVIKLSAKLRQRDAVTSEHTVIDRPETFIHERKLIEIVLCGDTKVERAGNRPVTKEDIQEKLVKFGGTDFTVTGLDIDIDEGIFLPMKAVNELRRDAIALLRKKMLKAYIDVNFREIENSKKEKEDISSNSLNAIIKEQTSNCCSYFDDETERSSINKINYSRNEANSLEEAYYRASVETKEQLDTCLTDEKLGLIYIESATFSPKSWHTLVQKIHNSGKKAGLRLPHIFRKEAQRFFELYKTELQNAGFDTLLVRNIENWLWLRENLADYGNFEIIFDHSIYSFNTLSDELIHELTNGEAIRLTAPLEENIHELHSAGKELTVYGRAPMMVSAQCIKNTVGGCVKCNSLTSGGEKERNINNTAASKIHDKNAEKGSILSESSLVYLKDRTGAMMPVRNSCAFCYNTIYNNVPLVIFDMECEITKLNPGSVRYEFTTEDAYEVSEILKNHVPKQGSFTRGHFKKSVE